MTENFQKMHHSIIEVKPTIATFIGLIAGGSNAAVWLDAIKGWAAVITVILGAPTALMIMVYWVLKVRYEWKNRNKDKNELR